MDEENLKEILERRTRSNFIFVEEFRREGLMRFSIFFWKRSNKFSLIESRLKDFFEEKKIYYEFCFFFLFFWKIEKQV